MKLEKMITRWARFLEKKMNEIALDTDPKGKGRYYKIHVIILCAVIFVTVGAVIFYLLNCVNDLNYQF